MPDETPDVAASSPAPEPAPTAPDSSGAVSPVQASDRPVENLAAEVHRRFGKFERQLESLTQYLATAQTQAQKPPQTGQQDVTDEDLWRLAQQGDRNAFDVYMTRIADRRGALQQQGVRREQSVDAQLHALGYKYPVFNDPNHPLTQTANLAYGLLIQQGYAGGKATMLEAIKTAIADRPDLVSEIHAQGGQAREGVRRSATQVAQAGQTGVAHRDTPAPPPTKTKPLSGKEAEIAQRMGVKDPGKSKERFLQRQADGRSQLGAVAGFVREEDL